MPDVSRNKNIGEIGANMNAATFRKFFNRMAWAQEPVLDFGDLSYLKRDAFEAAQAKLMAGAELWQGSFRDTTLEAGKVRDVVRVPEPRSGAPSQIVVYLYPQRELVSQAIGWVFRARGNYLPRYLSGQEATAYLVPV